MNSTYTIIVVVVVVILIGFFLGPWFARRSRSKRFHDKYGTEYDDAVKSMGNEKKAQAEMDIRKKHVKDLKIHSLTNEERARYVADWAAVQSKFVDEPAQAIVDADRLIMEVMQIRAYPISDFDQRASDLSVNYPELVSNYRAARAIAIKSKEGKADTEELRQAMIYYRPLFEELLETKAIT
jgi:FtsZ-interacting cell division protein ZipA